MNRTNWIMSQQLQDVLFLHWHVPAHWLTSRLPEELELDLFEEKAWVSAVLLKAIGTHIRGMPVMPGMQTFLQLNVRTYVKCGKRRGVYFFSMDSNSRAAVQVASLGGFLPYRYSQIKLAKHRDGIVFKSNTSGKANTGERLELVYKPKKTLSELTSLENWLTERYSLWTKPKEKLYRMDIHHRPWRLQYVEGDIYKNSLAQFLPVHLHHLRPIAHYSDSMEVLLYGPVVEEDVKKR